MKFPRNEKHKVKATLDLTPLIDVVFQLILFFLLTSTFVVQSSIPVELPEVEADLPAQEKHLTITLGLGDGGPENQGPVSISDGETEILIAEWAELYAKLLEIHEQDPEATVLISADRGVTTGRLITVMDYANRAGITKYGIAAQQVEEGAS